MNGRAPIQKNNLINRIVRFFRVVHLKLFRINDTPQKIAIGVGLGVFSGVMPGMGPLAALFFAFLFRVNRAAALLGSILTNTWLSIPTFILSVRAGAYITGTRYEDINRAWHELIDKFSWKSLFEVSIYNVIMPVVIGYVAIGLVIGALAYLATLLVVNRKKLTA